MRITSLTKIHPTFLVLVIIPRCIVVSRYLLIELKPGKSSVSRNLQEPITAQESPAGKKDPIFTDEKGKEIRRILEKLLSVFKYGESIPD